MGGESMHMLSMLMRKSTLTFKSNLAGLFPFYIGIKVDKFWDKLQRHDWYVEDIFARSFA